LIIRQYLVLDKEVEYIKYMNILKRAPFLAGPLAATVLDTPGQGRASI
jgi:hypothetical protein